LLVVDFWNKELICILQMGLGSSKFFGVHGSLYLTQCPLTLLTVRILNFISSTIILELMLLVFVLMI
jgi:hypothetical protein